MDEIMLMIIVILILVRDGEDNDDIDCNNHNHLLCSSYNEISILQLFYSSRVHSSTDGGENSSRINQSDECDVCSGTACVAGSTVRGILLLLLF